MTPGFPSLAPPTIALVAFATLAACLHGTGKLPSGPPPEYEETPIPDAGAPASPVLAAPKAAPPPPPAP